jgi:hypothetical protein
MVRVFSAALLLAAFALAGCQQNAGPATAPTASAAPAREIMLSTNTGSFTVFVPSGDPDNPVVYCSTAGAQVCPECRAAAIKYFKTGVLDPKCSKTGATRTVISNVSVPGHAVN